MNVAQRMKTTQYRWLTRVLLLFALLPLTGWLYQVSASLIDTARFQAPGRLVDVGLPAAHQLPGTDRPGKRDYDGSRDGRVFAELVT